MFSDSEDEDKPRGPIMNEVVPSPMNRSNIQPIAMNTPVGRSFNEPTTNARIATAGNALPMSRTNIENSPGVPGGLARNLNSKCFRNFL